MRDGNLKNVYRESSDTCPVCGGHDAPGGQVTFKTFDGRTEVVHFRTCGECRASWVDVYRMHHSHIVSGPEESPSPYTCQECGNRSRFEIRGDTATCSECGHQDYLSRF